MTNEEQALALIAPGVACEVNFENISILARAFTSAIEQRDATKQELSDYKQKVSDAVVCYFSGLDLNTSLHRFVIPAPKPDPLVEVIEAARINPKVASTQEYAEAIRTGLNAHGLQIVEKNDDR